MVTKILVEQEYGFKYWLWTSSASYEEMKDHFVGVLKEKKDDYYCKKPSDDFKGKWEEIDYDRYMQIEKEGYDGWGHIHEKYDSKMHVPFNLKD